MSRVAGAAVATTSLAGTFARAIPVGTALTPSGTYLPSTATATWSYSSAVSRTQYSYRVRLYSQDRSSTLYDTGTVVSSGTSRAVPYYLSGGSTYQVGVVVADLYDTAPETYVTFISENSGVGSFALNSRVGSSYEIGINGVGYMLADVPDPQYPKDYRYRRRIMSLDPPRFATGDTPFSQAIERYTLIGWSNWNLGAGIRLNDPGLTGDRFHDSEGIDPFTKGQLSLLPTTVLSVSNMYAGARMVVANSLLFVQTGAKAFSSQASVGGGSTAFSVAAATTVTDMTSDGEYWYATDGAGIFRNNASADPGAAWAARAVKQVEWVVDRIAVAEASSGSTPNQLTTLTAAGALEAVRVTLPVGTTIRSITGGNGYVWFAADRQDQSTIWSWQLGTTTAGISQFVLPPGQRAETVGFYQGNLMVRASEYNPVTSKYRGIIYRCATSNGALTPTRVLDIDNSVADERYGDFFGDDRFVGFSWRSMTAAGRSGIGVIDLSTGGYAKWLYAPADTATGDVLAVVNWAGKFVFNVDGYGPCAETSTALTTGWLKTWHTDLSSTLTKVLDRFDGITDPIPGGGSIAISYSLDGGNSYTGTVTNSSAGTQGVGLLPAAAGATIGVKVVLGSTGASPVVRALIARVHPLTLADALVYLPVNCSNRVAGLNGQLLREMNGDGEARARTLEALAQTRVLLQDVDWPITGVANTWEVVDVMVDSTGVFDRHKGRRSDSMIAVLTLRRSYT